MLQLRADQYHVGWICALSSELAAAKAMLDEQHQMLPGQDPKDTNCYTLGQIHKHNVVITCLPDGIDGTDQAAVVATHLSRTFPSVRIGLMVGIGGGIPNLQRGIDIRLGDIVVSRPGDNNGGVVQYEKGKIYNDGVFTPKGQLSKPPPTLLNALKDLRADHLMKESHVSQYLKKMLDGQPEMRRSGFSFPSREIDVLQCTHDAQRGASCQDCHNREVKREPRGSHTPVIHYGVIASGNKVVKSSKFRDQLRDEYDAICVEMEAAGLMDNFPCLVVRGICDYADSSKGDRWHNYAAATASAFAKELLSHVSVTQTLYEKTIRDVLSAIEDRLKRAEQRDQDQDIMEIDMVDEALYDSIEGIHRTCDPNTRVEVLDEIQCWAAHPLGKPILWLNGKAGSGKSTISCTFAKWLSDQDSTNTKQVSLGASFFFKRGEGDRGSAKKFFSTIVRQLINKIPGLGALVSNVVRGDRSISRKALAEQFRQLILQPLQRLSAHASQSTLVVVVVVDALDECEKEDDIEMILKLWSELAQVTTIKLRLFLTSRPDRPVRRMFQYISIKFFKEIDLMDDDILDVIQKDLSVYLLNSLSRIRDDYNSGLQNKRTLSKDWPSADEIKQLADLASPLFIVAATVCRFIGDIDMDPRESLDKILANRGTGDLEQMELIYVPVLSHLFKQARSNEQATKLHDEFRTIIGSIISTAEPLSVESLAMLLEESTESIDRQTSRLHAVLRVPQDYKTPIRTLHLSFAEFLCSDKNRKQPYGINSQKAHLTLSRQCLRLLSSPGGLRKNICDLTYAGQLRHEIRSDLITSRLSSVLQYCCQYWVYHVSHSGEQLRDEDKVHTFMKKHFLHWLEALSLIGRISDAIDILQILRSSASKTSPGLSAFLEDARRFVLANRYILDRAPLQLYLSAIMFAPEKSLIRRNYSGIPSWIKQHPKTRSWWSCELQKLEGDANAAEDIAFSPDGTLLASASGTIRLWNPRTGQELQKLDDHSGELCACAVAFSPDGSLLASGCHCGIIQLWETRTGRKLQELEGHLDFISFVSFSSDGGLIVSAGIHSEICLWEVSTGREIQTLKEHYSSVYAWTFSSDGSPLVATPKGDMIHLWEVRTGQRIREFRGHHSRVSAIAFSPDGTLVASGSFDGTICLRAPHTDQKVRDLKGHSWEIRALTFSSDGTLLASGDTHGTIQLSDLSTGQMIRELKGHSDVVTCVEFSHNDNLLASASWDHTVRLWELRSVPEEYEPEVHQFDRHHGVIISVVFSSCGTLLASGSEDGTVQLWYPSTGRKVCDLVGHTDTISSVVFSPNGNLLASASEDSMVKLWDPRTGQHLRDLQRHPKRVWHVAFSPNGTLLASGSVDGTIQLWNVHSNESLKLCEEPEIVLTMAFSPNGTLLAAGFRQSTIRLWETATGQELQHSGRHLENYLEIVHAVAFSPDNELVASASSENESRLFNVYTDQNIFSIPRPLTGLSFDSISTLQFSADCTTLITDRGLFDASNGSREIKSAEHSALNIANDWIRINNQNVVWLPHDYRGKSAIYGNRLAIGTNSASVVVFEFDCRQEVLSKEPC